MKPPEDIKRYFKKAALSTNPDKHEVIFEKILSAHEQVNKQEPETSRINLWRIIMKGPILKIVAAAVVVIACIIGLNMLDKTSGVVLANVLTQIERINTYMYDIDMTTQGQIIGNLKTNQKILYSREYGRKIILDINDLRGNTIHQEEYLVLKDKTMIQILPAQKTYTRMKVDDDYVERIRNQSYDPVKMIEKVLACKYNSLGITTIDGKTVEGFQTNDPNYEGGRYHSVDIKLWVDVETQLPVQMQMDVQLEGQINTNSSLFLHNFQWNVPIDVSEFEPVIPDDYTPMGGSIKIPENTEETAIKGLTLFADLFGSYPKELNIVTLAPIMMTKITDSNTQAAKQFQEELKGLSPEEIGQKKSDTLMPVLGAATFYILLVQDHKDPAYYGDKVKPGDAKQVLMRWKVSDNQYRVIFGGLHAETVTSDVLAELEKALPQKQ
jgi:outer membrane lipoprotein-sorting protein